VGWKHHLGQVRSFLSIFEVFVRVLTIHPGCKNPLRAGYGINCRGLHTFHLLSPLEEEIGPFAGNIYSDGMLTSPVHLETCWENMED
jgi:hypothetical protein